MCWLALTKGGQLHCVVIDVRSIRPEPLIQGSVLGYVEPQPSHIDGSVWNLAYYEGRGEVLVTC